MTVRAYPAYRDSGVAWIDAVPAHWQVKRISWLFRAIGSGTTPPTDHDGYYDGEVPWVTTGELRKAGISSTTKMLTVKALQDLSALSVYPVGTLLIAMYGATIGRLGWLEVPAAVNQACCAFAEPVSTNSRFVYYSLTAALEALLLMSSGGGQPNVNQEKLRAFRVPAPSLFEQSTIVAFLDRETGKIDALVAEQERLIALLKEKRQAVISHAVTKGLNPNAPMKDSGVPWLGEVPAHWEVKRLGWVCGFASGKAHEPFLDENGEYLCVTARFISTNGSSVRRCSKNLSPAQQGDILMVMSDLPKGRALARTYISESSDVLAVNQRVCIITPRQGSAAFFNYQLDRNPGLLRYDDGINQTHLSNSEFTSLLLVVPSREEQEHIATELDAITAQLDVMSEQAAHAIALLRERRAALISAAVTGKIDVRDTAPAVQDAA